MRTNRGTHMLLLKSREWRAPKEITERFGHKNELNNNSN